MKEIYFDNSATTRPADAVLDLYTRLSREEYGNPSSRHARGQSAAKRLSAARATLLSALGARDGHILFTAGGTEANNLARRGALYARKRNFDGWVFDSSSHESVTKTAEILYREFLGIFIYFRKYFFGHLK